MAVKPGSNMDNLKLPEVGRKVLAAEEVFSQLEQE